IGMSETFRNPQEEEQYRAHLQHFDRDAHVLEGGVSYAFSEDDFREIASGAKYYLYVPNGLNSWVFACVVGKARAKFRPQLTRATPAPLERALPGFVWSRAAEEIHAPHAGARSRARARPPSRSARRSERGSRPERRTRSPSGSRRSSRSPSAALGRGARSSS